MSVSDLDDDLDYDQFDEEDSPRFQSLEDLQEEEEDDEYLDDNDEYDERFPYRNTILDEYDDEDEELDDEDEYEQNRFDEEIYDSINDEDEDY